MSGGRRVVQAYSEGTVYVIHFLRKYIQLSPFLVPALIQLCLLSGRGRNNKFTAKCLAKIRKMPYTSTHSQSTISSYFQSTPQKRSNSYIDLTVENDIDNDDDTKQPSSKRSRLSSNTSTNSRDSPTRKQPPKKTTSTATAEDWRFSREKAKASQDAGGHHRQLSTAQKERHEAFKKKLLLDNSRFLQAEEEDDGAGPGGGGDGAHDEVLEDSDDRFEKLSEMFAHKSQVKANNKRGESSACLPARSKKVVELGPSGEPYTPLEKQVCYSRIPFFTFVFSTCWPLDPRAEETQCRYCTDG